MIPGFRFEPDAAHATACAQRMHQTLAGSLRYICDQSRGELAFDQDGIQRLIGRIEAGERFPPSTFALYYDLVPALLLGEEQRAKALFSELVREQPIVEPMRLLALDDPLLTTSAARYVSFMNSDGPIKHTFLPPPPGAVDSFAHRFASTLDLLQRAAPELVEEMRALISQVVLLVGPGDAKVHFEGGSSYRLWGAMFLNAVRRRTRIDIIESVTHENAHSRLFGFCTEEAAVQNPDDELHVSPLRFDARPMDGVYHATFVSARMHWTLSRVIESGLLTADELEAAEKSRAHDRRNFESGHDTVARHGRLTETGRVALDAATTYMSATA
jgi:HEXXH motif-containing protein